jgi:hypothetical protein
MAAVTEPVVLFGTLVTTELLVVADMEKLLFAF